MLYYLYGPTFEEGGFKRGKTIALQFLPRLRSLNGYLNVLQTILNTIIMKSSSSDVVLRCTTDH